MRFAEIPSRLIQLQIAPDPIIINHVIVNDPEDPNKTICYDIEVEVDDPYKSMVQNYLQNTVSNQELTAIDNKVGYMFPYCG